VVARAFSPLCLGGNVFGWTIDEATSHEVLDAYRARGGAFVDTADAYSTWVEGNSGGESERIVGAWLADRGLQGEVVVATKVGSPMPEGSGLAREYVLAAAERSRERLGVEAIDVLYAHRPDPATPILETMQAFDELVRRGTVRAVALSNYDRGQLRAALDACDEHGLARPVLLQPCYHLLDRSYEDGLAQLCVDEGIGVAPYYALAAGFLTGKYRLGAPAPDSARANSVLHRYGTEHGWAVLDRVLEVAARRDATPSQVAIAWLRTRPAIISPIASATSVAQVDELMDALDLELTPEDLALLD
jgi:aryl-alcohol dehydrogenase-like predicted oxidoreductase